VKTLVSNFDNLQRTMLKGNWLVPFHWCIALFLVLGIQAVVSAESKLDSAKAIKTIYGDWWNHETNSYNTPTGVQPRDNSLRKDGQIAEYKPTTSTRPTLLDLNWLGKLLTYSVISILLIALVIGAVLLAMHLAKSYSPSGGGESVGQLKIDMTRVEDLPFEASQWTGDPLAEARKLAQQGRFDEAIIYLYGYQLLALDQSRKIHLHKGKTNRMYIREIESLPDLQDIVELTMVKFEQVFFGKHSLTKQSFLEVWTKLDAFHSLIKSPSPSATGSPSPTSVGVAT
jgi:hypothetical protein